MSSEGPVFENAAQFEEYRRGVRERLEVRRRERSLFLSEATATLERLRNQANVLGLNDLAGELTGHLEAARALLGAAAPEASSGVAPAGQAPAEAAATPSASADPVPPAGPRIAPTAGPARETPRRPATRSVSEIDAQVTALEDQLAAEPFGDEEGLLRLKALACRQRRAFWELELQGAYTGHARALYGKIKGVVIERYGERRVLPLHTGIVPSDPILWETLAERYEAFIGGLDAYRWYRDHLDELPTASEREILEAIGAVQQQVYRLIDRQFPGGGDDQQRALYEELLRTADERQVFLESLNARTGDEELVRIGGALPKVRERLEAGLRKRRESAPEA